MVREGSFAAGLRPVVPWHFIPPFLFLSLSASASLCLFLTLSLSVKPVYKVNTPELDSSWQGHRTSGSGGPLEWIHNCPEILSTPFSPLFTHRPLPPLTLAPLAPLLFPHYRNTMSTTRFESSMRAGSKRTTNFSGQ
ncbi:unnamed protein product [Protopolystoma xenopodis]|uniref:Uncharacterized protein n=1 Tax=Protopolystoma xenopodis TaxID=117903 RepID=A0A448XBX8_9PLAT|nr:unnamed protein product [Protopolystoma xenopodis]